MNIKIIFLMLAMIGLISLSKGQDTTNTIGRVSISSPTAASLGKFGDIPVSYHTGIPQIDVPVYTVESGSLKLPVSLSYHASGLKVQENAGWVGAGWALNAGGVVTRSVVGAPDDRGNAGFTSVLFGHYSDFGYNNYLNTNSTTSGLDDLNFCRGIKDGEPDLFFFNFGSYSGKFYFNDDRTPILVPEADFKIQTFFQLGPGFVGFIITTTDGDKYYFGKTGNNNTVLDPIETTIPSTIQGGAANSNEAASSWFLNKVVSADGMDSITLNYQAENYSYYTIALSPMMWADYNAASADPQHLGTNLVKNFVAGVRLSQINFANGTINFTPSASPRLDLSGGTIVNSSMYEATNNSSYSLGSISITNNNGFCKKDSFYYGYFLDNTVLNSNFFQALSTYNLSSDEYRLRLDSIKESSCDQSLSVPPYKFSYFSELVPRRLSFGVDHWGYSNGITNNPVMVPTFSVITSGADSVFHGANRDGAWPAMRGGSLQKITYPTGGSTSFDFEPKDIDTFYSATLQAVDLANIVLHYYGQGALTVTQNVTLNSDGAFYFSVSNYSTNWAPTLTVLNSVGTAVAGTPSLINFSTTYNNTFVLPAGVYTITLAYPSNSGGTLINGAVSSFGQWQYVSTPNIQTIGGLRIKTITTNDGLTPNNMVTSYSYNGGGSKSTGVLYSIPTYVQILRNDLNELVWPSCSANGCITCDNMNFGNFNGHAYYVSPSSIRPMASVQGENLAYNEVDVSQPGNGKSVYRYYGSNLWTQSVTDVCNRILQQAGTCDATIPSYPPAPIPYEFMRDELSYEGHFNQYGQILKESYYYPEYTPDPLTTPGHIGVQLSGVNTGAGLYSMTEYRLHSARKTKSRVAQTTYDPLTSNSITTTNIVYYGSPFHNQPTRTVSFTSTGDSLVTVKKYAMDFRVYNCDAIPDSLTYYNTVVYNDSIAMVQNIGTCTPQGLPSDYFSCRRVVDSNYREQISVARQNFLRFRRHYYAPDSANIPGSCYLTALSTADTILKPILRLQNAYANPSIEETNYKNLNLLHASFTKYDTSAIPIGYAYPGRTRLINLQAPSSTYTNSTVTGNSIALDSRYVDESFYNFSKGKPIQVLGHDGVSSSYIWDYLNTEPIAKVLNSPIGQSAYTSFEADGKGGWSYSGTPISDATAITGTKDYSLSAGIITASGLDITKTYVVSYWSKTVSATVNATTGTLLISKNGWNYFEHLLSQSSSTVTVSGSVVIDELRLFPSTAQMTTYTYTPHVGMTSSCDVDNHISYYQYDALGRLKVVKDQDGNIIKTMQYHYQGQ